MAADGAAPGPEGGGPGTAAPAPQTLLARCVLSAARCIGGVGTIVEFTIAEIATLFLIEFPELWLFTQWHEVILLLLRLLLRLRLRLRLEPLIRADLGNVFSLALAILWSPEVRIIKGHRHIL